MQSRFLKSGIIVSYLLISLPLWQRNTKEAVKPYIESSTKKAKKKPSLEDLILRFTLLLVQLKKFNFRCCFCRTMHVFRGMRHPTDSSVVMIPACSYVFSKLEMLKMLSPDRWLFMGTTTPASLQIAPGWEVASCPRRENTFIQLLKDIYVQHWIDTQTEQSFRKIFRKIFLSKRIQKVVISYLERYLFLNRLQLFTHCQLFRKSRFRKSRAGA